MPYTCKACGTWQPGQSSDGICPAPSCAQTRANMAAERGAAPVAAAQDARLMLQSAIRLMVPEHVRGRDRDELAATLMARLDAYLASGSTIIRSK